MSIFEMLKETATLYNEGLKQGGRMNKCGHPNNVKTVDCGHLTCFMCLLNDTDSEMRDAVEESGILGEQGRS